MSVTPQLDYLFQYPVKSVLSKKDGSGFAIEFEGVENAPGNGSIIGVEAGIGMDGEDNTYDPNEIPKLEGLTLLTVIRSMASVRMVFGRVDARTDPPTIQERVEVEVEPQNYFIIDPRFGGEAFYPNRGHADEVPAAESIRAQFAGRFADGPEAPLTDEDMARAESDMPNKTEA